ncbi:MAG TPA: HD domain-containing protein [Ktedonobacterales bacterium]|nr:HD domain-containing protein [Ktedonobacterales bacterium]
MSERYDAPAHQSSSEATPTERKSRATGWLQPVTLPDTMYGSVRIAGWAAALLETAPFQRLAGVSLSDVPGPLLFGRPFPSRLDHAVGVYHLTRLARPRDRALQAAALAHDLGHGPFSHLTEPLMVERLGIDHEQRSSRLVFEVRDSLAPWIQRYLDWLDWDEVAALVQGQGDDGRGALLNGLLDYDNIDNIARFLAASGLGSPGYDPVTLARGLTLSPINPSGDETTLVVKLAASVADDARAWQHDRRIVYDYLHSGQRNLALHAMLRKAIDLAAASGDLAPNFLDYTDDEAQAHLGALPEVGVATLIAGVVGDMEYRRTWDAALGSEQNALMTLLSSREERLRLEARLAFEAGFAEHEVIVEPIVSSAERALPPSIGANGQDSASISSTTRPAMRLNVFASPGAPNDYLHRLQIAASRAFARFGARSDAEIGA